MEYQKPILNLIEFEVEDVITTSGDAGEYTSNTTED